MPDFSTIGCDLQRLLPMATLFEILHQRRTDTFQIAPSLFLNLGISTVFVLLLIFLLRFLLIRQVPDRPVFILYLLSGLLLELYVPAAMNGLDFTLGLFPGAVRMLLMNHWLLSFLHLNLILIAAIGAIGLIRGWRSYQVDRAEGQLCAPEIPGKLN